MSRPEITDKFISLNNAIRDGEKQTASLLLHEIAEYVDVMCRRLMLIRRNADYVSKTEDAPIGFYRDIAEDIVKLVDGMHPELDKFIASDGRPEKYKDDVIKRHRRMKPY